jgi:nicotinate-nucleotide adenylyltransferase
MRTLAFFGGSFDPPHVAHVLLASYALLTFPIDEVLVAPVTEHPLGKQLAAFPHRLRMCELAFADLSRIEISTIERGLPAPNRTLLTLERLKQERPDVQLRLLIGSDVLAEAHKWHAFKAVTELAPPLVVNRPGFEVSPGIALPDVSSTLVRELFGRRQSADLLRLSQLLPRSVLEYALDNELYEA